MPALETPSLVSNLRQHANPTLIFETLNRYQHTMALKGAIELELFTVIAKGATTSSAIATCCGASERGVRILCDFLSVAGFLTKSDEHYKLSPDAAFFLDKQSPAYMGTIADFVANDCALKAFRDVAALVRKGGTLDGEGTMKPENDLWVDFARSMMPIANMSAHLMASIVSQTGRKLKVLDIAAGHGLFGITVALRNPAATVFALDWGKVLDVAQENAVRAGVQDQFHLIAGSAFDVEFGDGYDLVLIPNFLHHFDRETNIRLLKKIRASMDPGGRVATLEFVPNEDRISPPVPASFAFMMLGRTERGDAYTFREFDRMFRAAGFGESTMQDLAPSPQRLLLTEF